jgi:hypothetical protein
MPKDPDYYTPEGHYLPRPLLLPEVRDFTELLTFVRGWDHRTMSHTGGVVPRPEMVPQPVMIGQNELGPYCSFRNDVPNHRDHSGCAVVATDLTVSVIEPRIVTDDDHLSFQVIYHKDRDRCLVIAKHGYIIGDHWLAYIDPATIPGGHVKKTIGRSLPNGAYVEIEAEERDGSDGLSPGFAITLTGWEKRGTWSGRAAKRNGREPNFGGADHDTILKVAPKLGPIVQAHLADPNGTPMHALANGWYFYSGAHVEYELKNYGQSYVDRHGTPHERAARSLSIPPEDLPEGLDRDQFVVFVEGLANRWAGQAEAARAVLAAMVDGDGVEDA